ncbi:hypothetical protein [Hymenobacter coccineus]|uniref:Uncharacterized protein n=1 Tax=Hymenobacter coccineus TaxID=1908235 RepID=A0A1G1SX45_9BACT|nr:hypothetical protein [Hymenobacter coccineus]OGX83206.1 hypothetical protein BEN49_12745 [Hymenobacter coccineus]
MKILLIFLLCSALISYYIYWREWAPVPPLVAKRVAEKPAPVATAGPRNIDNPCYYLVADDGSYAEVGPTTFACIAVGAQYASREWQGRAAAG